MTNPETTPPAAHSPLTHLAGWAEARTVDVLASDLGELDLAQSLPWLPRMALIELEKRADQLGSSSRAALVEWRAEEHRQTKRFSALVEAADENFQASLPPNWNEPAIELPDTETLETLLLDEGLPLAWVPPNKVLSDLLACDTRDDRLAVISAAAEGIVVRAAAKLSALESVETREWRPFAAEAAASMKSGQWHSGQALAANLLETLVLRFVRTTVPSAVKQSARPGLSASEVPGIDQIDDGNVRALLVVLGLWGAYSSYPAGDFTKIPTHFTRHASAHAVSSAQYNKINAVIALMHVVALLCLVEEG
jgi:hypothetical protein